MPPLDQHLCFALYTASRATTAAYRPLLARHGITYPQYLVLLALWEQNGSSVTDLGRRLDLDSGTLSPLIKRLEVLGFVERRRQADDERRVSVHLTETGLALRDETTDIPECLYSASGLTMEQTGALTETLRDLATRLRSNPGTAPISSDHNSSAHNSSEQAMTKGHS